MRHLDNLGSFIMRSARFDDVIVDRCVLDANRLKATRMKSHWVVNGKSVVDRLINCSNTGSARDGPSIGSAFALCLRHNQASSIHSTGVPRCVLRALER